MYLVSLLVCGSLKIDNAEDNAIIARKKHKKPLWYNYVSLQKLTLFMLHCDRSVFSDKQKLLKGGELSWMGK